MYLIKGYFNLVVICLIVEGLLKWRLLKYRQTWSTFTEITVTLLNSFVPIFNILILIKNINLLFSDNEMIKTEAVLYDLIENDSELNE